MTQGTPRSETAGFFAAVWRDLVAENAMMLEAGRNWRNMWGGAKQSRSATLVMFALLGLLYVWFIFNVLRYGLDTAEPVTFFTLVIITLFAPSTVFQSISGEREKATWDALVLTRLTPAQIIAGKLGWRLGANAVVVFLMFLISLAGQVTTDDPAPWDMLILTNAYLLAWGALLSAFTLWVSACTRRVAATTAIVIGTVLAALALVPLLLSQFSNPRPRAGFMANLVHDILAVNPFSTLGWMMGSGTQQPFRLLPSLWPFEAIFIVIVACLLGAALFITLAWRRVQRLEEPVRAS